MITKPVVTISVIIPVFNGTATVRQCLEALAESRVPAAQWLLVDDGSTDGSAALAQSMGATVFSTDGRFGPARARNLGAIRASGDVLLFIDADVAVHADVLERVQEKFQSDADLDALIGSYDDAPSGPGFVSQFKNLLHAFIHREGNHRASTFWCGCGAIRRSVFLEHGGLDESYQSASVEDIELGLRLFRAGRKVVLDPSIQGKHLKVWKLWSMITTDVVARGIPWTNLILRTQMFPNDLNLRWSQRISGILSGLLLLLVILEAATIAAGTAFLPPWGFGAGFVAAIVSIYLLNRKFYRFLACRKGGLFAFGALWLHILYFLYSCLSFVLGTALHCFRTLVPEHSKSRVIQPLLHKEKIGAEPMPDVSKGR
jgi:glycosyltransferase involved in cell wall biosynthesis